MIPLRVAAFKSTDARSAFPIAATAVFAAAASIAARFLDGSSLASSKAAASEALCLSASVVPSVPISALDRFLADTFAASFDNSADSGFLSASGVSFGSISSDFELSLPLYLSTENMVFRNFDNSVSAGVYSVFLTGSFDYHGIVVHG